MRLRGRLSALICALVLLGVFVGGILVGGHPNTLPPFAREFLFPNDPDFAYREAMDTIRGQYYQDVDTTKLTNSSIDAAVESLHDRFSAYIDPKLARDFDNSNNGKFEGIGVTITPTKAGLRVRDIAPGSPALRGGIKVGETIVTVDGKSIAGEPVDHAANRIRGKAGTTVRLEIESRKGARRPVAVKRERLAIPIVASRTIKRDNKTLGYLRLAGFTNGVTDATIKAVKKLTAAKVSGLILDLRNNPGGFVSEAVGVASAFIESGKIVSTSGRHEPTEVYKALGDPVAPKTPMVVLVNGESASSAEILSSALQDSGRAKVIGEQTFGKGVYQRLLKLSNGGVLDLTVGRYFTRNGRNLAGRKGEKGGVHPDIVVAGPTRKNPRDLQVDRAIKELVGGR